MTFKKYIFFVKNIICVSCLNNPLFPPGVLGVDCSAAGDICLCGCFHLCGPTQVICHDEHLDLLGVLCNIFCFSLCD